MTTLHEADCRHRLTRFLARKSCPKHLADPAPQADEIAALLAAVIGRAPRDPDALRDWWPQFEAALDDRCGRTWPTVKEIREAASGLMQPATARPSEPGDIDAAAIAGKRMAAGEPVGEGWLYGFAACELIARGLVDQPTMDRYRRAAHHRRARLYGDAAADEWQAEARAAHEAAKPLWRARDEFRQRRETRNHLPSSERLAA